ncbi:MAG: hypothetical protein IKD89_03060 [Clostridia bacterium]|nr:hypothetical protein [Clostridia bacterium]
MSEREVGVTAPPFHPWCRTTTAPYFEDDFDVPGERAARDAEGGTYYVPADMTYEQWKKKQDEKYGESFIDRERKKAYKLNSKISDSAKARKYRGSSELVLLRDKRRFSCKDVLLKSRKPRTETEHDTEAKLFEYFADLYEKAPFKSITMLSERGMCESCQGVMEQFKKAFPEVEINVVSNKAAEGDVWKHRWRKKK